MAAAAVDPEEYAQQAAEAFPANVVMFSGCRDEQTSADVANVSSFGLPTDAGPGGAGGACTCSMIKALEEKADWTWASLLAQMRRTLAQGRYTQIPQLSSSRAMDMNSAFSIAHPEPSGRRRALMVGINYPGSSCPLNGCHNDVETMSRYLSKQGYAAGDMTILMDDGRAEKPTKAAMEAGMKWLVQGAAQGDSLFFHYSGHGAQQRDTSGDEADGMDEALCPADFETAGLLSDDDIYCYLVGGLAEGVRLTCVLDCCHSGTILDLPYSFKADEGSLAAVENGSLSSMMPNEAFQMDVVKRFVQKRPLLCVAAGLVGGAAYCAMGEDGRRKVTENQTSLVSFLMCCMKRDLGEEEAQAKGPPPKNPPPEGPPPQEAGEAPAAA